jgi:beta-lactamase class A
MNRAGASCAKRAIAGSLWPAAVLLASCAAPALAVRQQPGELRHRIEVLVREAGAEAAVAVRDLVTGDSLLSNPDLEFHAASTMKVAVMVAVFRQIDAGRLALHSRVAVADSFRSLVGGGYYRLSAADDSDSSLYRRVGRTATVRDLVELMITVSSNLATNILIDLVSADSVRAAMRSIGVDGVRVLRGVEDGEAFRAGLNNTVTARGLATLFEAIADARAAAPWSCGAMLEILARQRVTDGIPSGLPRRARVAHKPGWITALHHDAGVVYERGRPRYAIVVLTRGLADRSASGALIGGISRLVNDAFQRSGQDSGLR